MALSLAEEVEKLASGTMSKRDIAKKLGKRAWNPIPKDSTKVDWRDLYWSAFDIDEVQICHVMVPQTDLQVMSDWELCGHLAEHVGSDAMGNPVSHMCNCCFKKIRSEVDRIARIRTKEAARFMGSGI